MIFRLLIIIHILFLSSIPLVFSQEQVKSEEEEELQDKAFAFFEQEKYLDALPLMSQLLSIYPKEPNYNYGYAVCLIETNQQTEKAIKYLQYADSKSDNPRIKYYLGRAFHLNYKFDDAIQHYTAFSSTGIPADKKKFEIDNKIAMCNNGKELIKYISDLTVVDNKKIKSENYYYSYELKDYGGKLIVKPLEFKSKIDKKLEKSNTVVFLPNNSKTVFYGSFGEKNIAGRDIFQVTKQEDGTWSKPISTGTAINTPFDDDFPVIQSDGKTMFFSSKGHNSMGGFDIYKSVFDSTSGTWSKPINLDFPINTPYDDYMFVPDKEELYAYFTSNRETNGDKISVYKIIIDQNPVEREFKDLEEIINTSKLEVSPLADIKRVENSRTEIKKNPILSDNSNASNNSNTLNYSNKYAPITFSPNLTTQDLTNEVAKDEKEIKDQASDIRKQSNMAYLAADEQNKIANEKRKQAANKTNELNSISDPVEKEKKSQEVYDLITDAENLEREAVTAYNIAKNLDQVATEMERDVAKTKNLQEAINTSENTSNESLVEAINKNKERLTNSQNKYTSLEAQIDNRANLALTRQKEFEQTEREYQANSSDISSLEDEISTLKQQIDNETDPNNKSMLNFSLEEKTNQLNQNLAKDSILESQYEKLKIEKENLATEVNFLSSLKNRASTDSRPPDQLSNLVKNINKDQLQNEIFNKELTADVKNANTIVPNNNTEVKNTNLTAENNQATQNNNTVNNNPNNTNPQNNVTNNNKNVYQTNPVFPFSSDTSNSSSKLVAYQKEILNAQYYDNLVKEQEKQLSVLQNTLNNVKDNETKTSINNEINALSKDIEKNKAISKQSNSTAQNLKKAALTEVDTSLLTNEQLVLNATNYNPVNKLYVSPDQNQTLINVQNNHTNLKEIQKEFNVVTTEIKDLEKALANADSKTQKEINTQIENKRVVQNDLLRKFENTSKESNQNESSVYSDLIRKNKEIDVKNPNLRFANMLEKESEIYFEKATNIRKDADLLDDPESKKAEYQKADNIEQIAIQKQKYALDLYISNKKLTASENGSNVKSFNQNNVINADTNIVKRTTEITLNPDEEQQLKTYRQESHKAEVLLTASKADLEEVESKRAKAASTFSETEKKNILKGVDSKEQKALDMMLNAYKNYGRADSMKYMVYKNQIQQFQSSASDIGNNKVIAKQYTQEADFYFSEATRIRQRAETITDKKEKADELARATEFEKKALTSQELAVDVLTDVNPVFFVSTSDLTKVDRLDVLNQPVDVSTIIKIKTERIVSKINPTEEELKKLDEAESKRSISAQLIEDANKFQHSIDSLQNIVDNSSNPKDKNKALKQIQKIEKKMFASQFTAAEIDESINSSRYYLYKEYFTKNRLSGNTTEARQGKQLEKDANSKYSKARSLREKGFMKEDARKAYELMVEAKALEEEAIEDQERAFGVYFGLKPLEDEIKEYAEAHKNNNKNENNLIIKSTANVTPIDVNEDTTTQVIAAINYNENPNNNKNLIVENSNPVDTNSQVTAYNNVNNVNNNIEVNNTNPPDNNENKNLIIENTNPVDTNNQVVANNTNPPDNNENKNLTIENTNPVDTSSQVTADINLNNNNSTEVNNTNPPDNNENKNLTIENTNPVDTSSQVTADINLNNSNNTEVNNTNPPDNNQNKNLVVENNQNNTEVNNTIVNNTVSNPPDNSNNTSSINDILNTKGFGFSVLPVNAYSEASPIPMNSPLPDGLVFKVQIGAFKSPVNDDAFKGLNPISGETLQGSAFVRYYVGLFFSEEAANIVKNQIRPLGYKDAFVVAYYNGKKISLFEARRMLKDNSSPENYNLLAQAEVEKIRNRTNNIPVNQNQVNTNQGNNQTQNIVPVKSSNINETSELFYTVQIGVYKNPVTAADLKNLSPIYQDNAYGFIRYTTGKFTDPKKAEIEKNKIVQLGISDAFVSAYYNGKKITLAEAANIEKQNPVKSANETEVTYPEQPILSNQNNGAANTAINKDEIVFKVQIGAFKEQVPVDKVQEFLKMASKYELSQEKDETGTTIYSIGRYKEYSQAVQYKDMLINEGYQDAFITAYSGSQKISVKEAKSILNQ